MKVFSAALLLLGSGLVADAAKNPHGFDPAFLKAMTQGSKKSPFLKDVTNYERKQFWKNLLKKAKPASSVDGGLRASAEKEKANKKDAKVQEERKLGNSYNQYGGQYNNYNANNANGNNANYNNNNANNNNNGNDNADANNGQYYNRQYNYGGNNYAYNYNGNGQEEDNAYYDEEDEYYGVDWTNLGFDMRQYSLKYTGCSAVKTYDSYKAASGYDDVLSTKRFALFRLCPSNNCNKYSVNGCGRNYGEYVLEMDSFLEGVVEFNRQRYWHYCHFCRRCNGLESYGERMSELTEEQMEYYEEMQAEAESYYEAQQEMYQQENQDYASENAANYNYYNAYNNNNGNNNNANYNNYANYNEDVDGGGNGRRKVRKLQVPKTKRQLRELSNYNNNNNNNNGNSNSNMYNNNGQQEYYRSQKYQQYKNGEITYDEYKEYLTNMNENMYNAYYWDESVYGEWEEEWSEAWLAFNWQVLPYCSESELEACEYADDMCEDYDENFEEDADAMGGFSACTQIDDGMYIGPHCNSDGFTITLGVYSDEYCDIYIGNEVSLYDVLGYDIDDQFDFFPQECVTCEEGGEEREFVSFMEANEDFDNYEEWLDTRWQEYVEMAEEMYEENMGYEQNQYYNTQQAYYNAQNYQDGNQQGYYYKNGAQYQQGGGSYYYGDNSNNGNNGNNQQYARYGGEYYQNKQMAEAYGNYGASMLNNGMNFYYNRGQAGDWITNEVYDKDEWAQEQQEEYGEYYWYRQSQKTFAKSGISDVCGALYTYAAKCNKHLTTTSSDYTVDNSFAYSYGSENQEANEEQVCNFIDNLQTQKYDEYGDIVLDASQLSNGYVIDFAGTNWRDPDQVKAQAQKTGVTAGQAAGLALTMAACMVMAVWACCLHSTLARKNIPWRPKRGKLTEPTDITRQNSGIVMGRSRSGMSGKATPLI